MCGVGEMTDRKRAPEGTVGAGWSGSANAWLHTPKDHKPVVLACALGALLMGVSLSWAGAGPPTEAVRTSINEVIGILTDEALKKPNRSDERRQRVEQAIGKRFNYEEMAKRSLGAHWKTLNDKDQQEFVSLFQQLLSASYSGKIEGYSGEQVQYLNERREGDYAEVRTKVVSGKVEIPLYYRLLNQSGDWRVYDVVVDGVSLVSNYRGQFTQILRDSNHAELVAKLKQKIEQLKTP